MRLRACFFRVFCGESEACTFPTYFTFALLTKPFHDLYSTVFAEVLLGGCRILNLDPDKAVVDGMDGKEL